VAEGGRYPADVAWQEALAPAPTSKAPDDLSRPDPFILGIIAISVLGLWIRPLFTSLWLDELATWWVVRDGFDDTIGRAWEYQQSPAYYVVAWTSRSLFGSGEAMLRLPSLLALGIGAVFMYRLVLTLFDREAARLAVLTFCVIGPIAFAANDARPYALSVAAFIIATYLLVRWLDDGSTWFMAGYIAAIGFAIWFHYFAAIALTAHAVYAFVLIHRRGTPVTRGRLVAASACIALVVAPLIGHIASLWSRRGTLSVPDDPATIDLIVAIVSPVIPAAFFLGALIARAEGRVGLSSPPVRPATLALLTPWLLAPPAFLFLVSVATPVKLMSPRYFVWCVPAAAIFAAWGLRSFDDRRSRRIVAAVLAILAVATSSGAAKYGEEWAAASAFVLTRVDDDTPVLLHAAFIESAQIEWLDDPERGSYLSAPASRYSMGSDVRNLPYVVNDEAIRYVDALLPSVTGGNRFFVVTRYPFVPWPAWIRADLRDEGWRGHLASSFGVIQVWEYERADTPLNAGVPERE
jgi:mannosyltransferase